MLPSLFQSIHSTHLSPATGRRVWMGLLSTSIGDLDLKVFESSSDWIIGRESDESSALLRCNASWIRWDFSHFTEESECKSCEIARADYGYKTGSPK
jgi:hypothetical protein